MLMQMELQLGIIINLENEPSHEQDWYHVVPCPQSNQDAADVQWGDKGNKSQWVPFGSVRNACFWATTSHLSYFRPKHSTENSMCDYFWCWHVYLHHPFPPVLPQQLRACVKRKACAKRNYTFKSEYTDHTRHKNIFVWPLLQKNKNTARSLASASWSWILACSCCHSNFPP